MTTKEQERKALEQIKKIVEGLGENSYIGTAFEGCFEVAEDNIENDFACSMKQRAEAAEKKAAKLELDNRDLRLAVVKAKETASKEITALQLRIEELGKKCICPDDLTDCIQLVEEHVAELDNKAKEAAGKIVAWADEPGCSLFIQAVKDHRSATRSVQYYGDVLKRLRNMQNVPATEA